MNEQNTSYTDIYKVLSKRKYLLCVQRSVL